MIFILVMLLVHVFFSKGLVSNYKIWVQYFRAHIGGSWLKLTTLQQPSKQKLRTQEMAFILVLLKQEMEYTGVLTTPRTQPIRV